MSYLLYLRSFVSVYRHSSISRAASALSLTQPAVSRHVKLLEGRLGATLFTRLPRGLAPTPAAVELERQAGPHLDALEGMLDARAQAARWPASRMSAPPAASSRCCCRRWPACIGVACAWTCAPCRRPPCCRRWPSA